jgi:hypothetical protein
MGITQSAVIRDASDDEVENINDNFVDTRR